MLTCTCHCGAVIWTYQNEPKSVTVCNCSIHASTRVRWIYGTEQEDVHGNGAARAYVRAYQGALELHHSLVCGKTISCRSAQPKTKGKTAIAVNFRLADAQDDVIGYPIRHFDGRHACKEQPGDHRTAKEIWF